jgi:hypothetical protein
MPVEGRDPAVCRGSDKMGGKGGMIKTPSGLQDLSKSLYDKAKAEPTWRFWGLYVHVCKMETLQEAYEMARKNNGAPYCARGDMENRVKEQLMLFSDRTSTHYLRAINCGCTFLRSLTCCCRCCGAWDWKERSWPRPSAPPFGSRC